MKQQDIINYILSSPSNLNWAILEGMIFSWKEEENHNSSEKMAGLLNLNKVKQYILTNNNHINPIILRQLLEEVEEIIVVLSDYESYLYH